MTITTTGNASAGGAAIHIAIDPRATFLRTNSDAGSLNATAISLASLGISSGDLIGLQSTGEYFNGTTDVSGLTAVMSTSATLLASTSLNRVSGALETQSAFDGSNLPDVATPYTATGNQTTNIVADFALTNDFDEAGFVRVPTGGTHLFLSPNDNNFGNNTDADGDFGINIYRPLVVAASGTGTLTISGETLYRDLAVVGMAAGSSGTLNIESGSSFTIGGQLSPDGVSTVGGKFAVGPLGEGTVVISGGSVVTVAGTVADRADASIGGAAGSVGTLTVTGANSVFQMTGYGNDIELGRAGTGTMNAMAGGVIRTSTLYVAEDNIATVNIDGVGSKVVVSNDTGARFEAAGRGGFAGFGFAAGSSASLNVTNGGILEVRNTTTEGEPLIVMGMYQGSTSVGIVDGAGSAINLSMTGSGGIHGGPVMFIGVDGQATLTIQNNGALNITGEDAFLGISGALGPDAAPPPTSQLAQSHLIVQSGGDVMIDVEDTEDDNYKNVSVGVEEFGNGAITVTGAGSTFSVLGNNNEIYIGDAGTGSLTISAGGVFNAQNINVGEQATGVGTLTVTGAGSQLNLVSNNPGNTDVATATLDFGDYGNGTLSVLDGGQILIDAGDDKRPVFAFGGESGSVANGTISGTNSRVTLTTTNTAFDGGGIVAVGFAGGSDASLTISNGGQLLNTVGSTNSIMGVGIQYGGSGDVIVDGNGNAATLLDAGHLLAIGAGLVDPLGAADISNVDFFSNGYGSLMVTDSAVVRADNIVVGRGGGLVGNSRIEGDVTIVGGALGVVANDLDILSTGKLTLDGDLSIDDGKLGFAIGGTTAVTQYSQMAVSGAVSIETTRIIVELQNGFTLTDGNVFKLIDGADTLTFDQTIDFTLRNAAANQAFLIGDTGNDLVFEALNTNGVGPALVDFGSSSTIGATATIDVSTGFGTGTGGRFDSVAIARATGLNGTAAADTLSITGSAGGTLNGNGGNDTFVTGSGADAINGGSGLRDRVDYSNSNAGVTIGLGNVAGTGGHAAGDTLLGVEDLTGSAFNDTLTGNTNQNIMVGGDGADNMSSSNNNDQLFGGNGDDTLAGGAGADIIDGGNDTDTVSFSNAAARITLTLVNGAGTATGSGQGAGDSITNVENITGSAFNDILTGDANANTILGGAGSDTLNGGAGDDIINGQSGLDTINGGAGNDTLTGSTDADKFVYNIADAWDDDQIIGWQNNADKIDLVGAGFDFADFTKTQDGADTLLTLTADPNQTIRLVGINANSIDVTDFV